MMKDSKKLYAPDIVRLYGLQPYWQMKDDDENARKDRANGNRNAPLVYMILCAVVETFAS